eukprot:412637-Amphidinium_carterae.1
MSARLPALCFVLQVDWASNSQLVLWGPVSHAVHAEWLCRTTPIHRLNPPNSKLSWFFSYEVYRAVSLRPLGIDAQANPAHLTSLLNSPPSHMASRVDD